MALCLASFIWSEVFKDFVVCGGALSACVPVHHVCAVVLAEARRGHLNWSFRLCEPPDLGTENLNLDPLPE